MTLSKAEQQHYDRHILLDTIGIEGQIKLKAAKVLVIGAGGLGCPVLQYLTAVGVGTIGIIDNDHIDASNLQRQILYTYDDLGTLKVDSAAKRLQALNPFVKFNIYAWRLTKDNALELFNAYDVIVDGTDNFATRYLINDAAVITGKPVVFGSIFKFEGQVSVFNFKEGPTYRCLYPKPPNPIEVPNCSEIGVLGILPGIIGSFQANEVIKILCDIGTVLSGQLLTYNALNNTSMCLAFSKSDSTTITDFEDSYEVFCGVSVTTDILEVTYLDTYRSPYQLLDIREDWERSEYHMGGLHIPLHELPEQMHQVPNNKTLIVYCETGARSQIAIALLKESGFNKPLLALKLKA